MREAAERLGVSVRTIQRQLKAVELPAVKIGGAVRVQLSALFPSEDEIARLAHEVRFGRRDRRGGHQP